MKELEELAGKLEVLREQIARSRSGRHRRAQLPAELWTEAATWAKKLGAYRASRALGVSYESLRSKTTAREQGEASPVPAFVEFSAAQLMDAPVGTVVELADATGVRLTIRLAAGQPLDVTGLVALFRGAQR